MSKSTDLLNSIKAILFSEEKPVELMAEAVLADGTKIGTDAKEFEDGAAVYVIDENGEKLPLPSGEYQIEGGAKLTVTDGVIDSMVVEEEQEAEEMSDENTEEQKEEKEEGKIDLSNYVTNDVLLAAVEAIENKFEERLTALTSENSDLKEKVQKLSKMSAEKPTKKSAPVNRKYDSGNKYLDMIHELKNN